MTDRTRTKRIVSNRLQPEPHLVDQDPVGGVSSTQTFDTIHSPTIVPRSYLRLSPSDLRPMSVERNKIRRTLTKEIPILSFPLRLLFPNLLFSEPFGTQVSKVQSRLDLRRVLVPINRRHPSLSSTSTSVRGTSGSSTFSSPSHFSSETKVEVEEEEKYFGSLGR